MRTSNLVDTDISLRNRLIQDILSKKTTLAELSIKYGIEVSELFSWVKN